MSEKHEPFLKSLLTIGVVTIVLMVLGRFYIEKYYAPNMVRFTTDEVISQPK